MTNTRSGLVTGRHPWQDEHMTTERTTTTVRLALAQLAAWERTATAWERKGEPIPITVEAELARWTAELAR